MIVLDASVLIEHLDSRDAHHERATALLLDAIHKRLATSPLTLPEVLVGPAEAGQKWTRCRRRSASSKSGRFPERRRPRAVEELRVGTQLRLPD